MNIEPYLRLDKREVIDNLEQMYMNPEYDKWDKTLVFELCLYGVGLKGDRARELSNILFDDFITWSQKNQINKNLSTKFVENAHIDIINIYNLRVDGDNVDQIVKEWLNDIEDFDNYYEPGYTRGSSFLICNII